MSQKIVAAFDLATATGVCDGAVGAHPPRLFSWYLRDGGDSRPDRLLELRSFLVRYFAQEPCDAVVYEAPMHLAIMARIGAQEETVAFLRGSIGVLEMTCAEFKKDVVGVNVQDARQSVLGWRANKSNQKTKRRVMDEVKQLGVLAENDNEADAYVVWAYACNRLNPRLAMHYTPLFQGKAGIAG